MCGSPVCSSPQFVKSGVSSMNSTICLLICDFGPDWNIILTFYAEIQPPLSMNCNNWPLQMFPLVPSTGHILTSTNVNVCISRSSFCGLYYEAGFELIKVTLGLTPVFQSCQVSRIGRETHVYDWLHTLSHHTSNLSHWIAHQASFLGSTHTSDAKRKSCRPNGT